MGDTVYRVGDRMIQAHIEAPPRRNSPWPGVVVLHEVNGLNEDIRRHCRHFAAQDYLAIAPDMYSGGLSVRCMRAAIRDLSRGTGEAFEVVDGARRVLLEDPECSGRIGVVGFGMGAGFALLMAPRQGWSASAVNYGQVPEEEDLAATFRGACPLVASYGAKAGGMAEDAERLGQALEAAGVEHDLKVYPEAGLSFMNRHPGPLRVVEKVVGMGYHGDSARDAWERIFAVFDRALKGEGPGQGERLGRSDGEDRGEDAS